MYPSFVLLQGDDIFFTLNKLIYMGLDTVEIELSSGGQKFKSYTAYNEDLCRKELVLILVYELDP